MCTVKLEVTVGTRIIGFFSSQSSCRHIWELFPKLQGLLHGLGEGAVSVFKMPSLMERAANLFSRKLKVGAGNQLN